MTFEAEAHGDETEHLILILRARCAALNAQVRERDAHIADLERQAAAHENTTTTTEEQT